MKAIEVTRRLVYQCEAEQIDVTAYWNHQGEFIPSGGSQVYKFPKPLAVQLYAVEKSLEEAVDGIQNYKEFDLYVDEEHFEIIGQIINFKDLKTKIQLDCCVGAD
jgi:hypothetical protein